MIENPIPKIEEQLVRHEGLRLKPYRCTSGKLTIGVGRNLDDKGISESEAMMLLWADMRQAEEDAGTYLGEPWRSLAATEPVRAAVLVNMAFNLGLSRLQGFRRLRQAIGDRDWEWAAMEMMDSAWAEQVGARAVELGRQMRTGVWQNG